MMAMSRLEIRGDSRVSRDEYCIFPERWGVLVRGVMRSFDEPTCFLIGPGAVRNYVLGCYCHQHPDLESEGSWQHVGR